MKWRCRCEHVKAEHTGSSGPNSIGQWFFGQCVNGSKVIAPYRFGGCQCRQFRLSLWQTVVVPMNGGPADGSAA